MKRFLSCDWGTSSFRLKLVESDDLTSVAEETSDLGIAPMHQRWLQSKGLPAERFGFYQATLAEHIERLAKKSGVTLDGIPIILSGMASSTMGMKELSYKELPFSTTGIDLFQQL